MLSFNQLSALVLKGAALSLLIIALTACGGSSGGSGGGNTPTSSGSGSGGSTAPEAVSYSGPAPRDEAVQSFRSAVWSELALPSRCGACHDVGGAGSPAFMNTANINDAYDTAINLMNTSTPASSRLVTKVLEGHNCWLTNDTVCANLITTWIQNMASSGDTTTFLGALNLTDPVLKDIGQSKQFPALADEGTGVDFESTIYPLTSVYCSSCHSENSALKQQPYIGSSDVQVAYEAARTRINLEDGSLSLANALSRLVIRLRDEGHNCWNGSCAASSAAMHSAIQAFASNLSVTAVDADLVVSRALTLDDGLAASSGAGRVETNVIAKWNFGFGSGSTAFDISGVDPALDLNIIGNVEWLASGGVRINDGKLQGSTTTSAKLYDRITTSGEYSIEAWVVPLNVTQDGPARIVTYSGSNDRRNFMLGQTLYDYNFQARSSTTDADGQPAVSTPMADEVLQATLQHVVATYSATEGRKLYVNGALIVDNDPEGAGNFNSWDRNFAFVVGDEVSNDNQWQGSVRFLAIHDRALAAADIQTNYDIGVGQKFYLLFSISNHISIPRSYIVMQVEQFDDYGYLFNEPFFVSLEPNASITDVIIKGLRIGINGKQATSGQAYANVDTTITQTAVDTGEGRQILSTIGTIIGADQGPAIDEFFLTFEQLGLEENVYVEGTPTAQVPVPRTDEQSDIGVKTFDEINEALSALTTISKTNPSVASTFDNVKQQLPTNENIQGFLPAHQMGIAQLAVQYCSQLVTRESSPSATGYFLGFNFNAASPAVAFTTMGRSQIVTPLLDNLLANTVTVADQPLAIDTEAELNNLIDNLISNCVSPPPGESCVQNTQRVRDMVAAVCSATFASGMMLFQ